MRYRNFRTKPLTYNGKTVQDHMENYNFILLNAKNYTHSAVEKRKKYNRLYENMETDEKKRNISSQWLVVNMNKSKNKEKI